MWVKTRCRHATEPSARLEPAANIATLLDPRPAGLRGGTIATTSTKTDAASSLQGGHMTRYPVARTIKSALAVTALAAASGAVAVYAQVPPSTQPSSGQKLQEIVVTGSLLRRTDAETPSPVTVISTADIQATGYTTFADVVRTLSADNSGTLPTSFGLAFAAGSSGVALRGLTVNSTLVLIDGRRAANYALADDGVRSFVDLNTIPIDAVERIEVLKDGASSIYGADAIAGVIKDRKSTRLNSSHGYISYAVFCLKK